MKQLKIKQEFLDNIKNGLMNFYITKENLELNNWTKVELIVQDCNLFGCYCNKQNEQDEWVDIDSKCIKKWLIVELKQTEMTAFEIGSKISTNIALNLAKNEIQISDMYIDIENFVSDYYKQGDTLYWYDLRLVE